MLGVWDKILVGLQQVRTIAHRRQVLDLLPRTLLFLIVLLPQTKPRDMPKMKSTASQSPHWDFFSDDHSEFIDFDEGAGLGLWWACWECLDSLYQPVRDCLVMDAENPADGSHHHPFEIELKGLLLEGWIFASWYSLKDSSASLATVALDTTAGAVANRVRMSTVRTLHH